MPEHRRGRRDGRRLRARDSDNAAELPGGQGLTQRPPAHWVSTGCDPRGEGDGGTRSTPAHDAAAEAAGPARLAARPGPVDRAGHRGGCVSRQPPMTLRPVVERLLLDVVADGFVVYCCGDRTGPTALVASYEWADYIDVVTIRNFERITAARVPINGKVDVFAPEVAVWSYEGPAEWTLRALLDLVHPTHPDAPTATYPAPRALHIPRAEQRPMTIRPSSPGRAGARATRLAADGCHT